ncbi:hypothetical protein FKW77_003573 [Venturia effusa]|uniref:RING-type domain-containing protein n=1 Tax=Venturia effusa TaxID=50376 RepID=A0A517LAQ2_9PEZI|nr:hypothetical protein FKW77_003573 [Venturia effusa]
MRADGCRYEHDAAITKVGNIVLQPALRPTSKPSTQLQGLAPSFIPKINTDWRNAPIAQPDHVEELSPDDESQVDIDDFTRELCGALAHFQVGAQVSKVSFSSDFSAVRINGLPEDTTPDSVRVLLSSQDIDIALECIRVSRPVSSAQAYATLKVEDPAFGRLVCSKFASMEDLGAELSNLEVIQLHNSLPNGTNASRVDCKKVQCSWFKPSRTAWLNFGNETIAQRVSDKFKSKRYKIRGKAVRCGIPTGDNAIRRGGRRNPLAWTVMLTELPIDATEQEIREALKAPSDSPRNIELGDPSYETEGELSAATVMSLLGRFGRIEWSQTNTELEGRRAKAVARFYEEMDAREAAQSLNGKPLDFCKSLLLTAQLISTAKFKVAANIFAAIQARIRVASQTWKDQHLGFKIYPAAGQGQQYRILRIEGQNATDVAAAKAVMDEILEGVVVKRNSLPLWTTSLSNNGKAFQRLKKIQEDLGIIITRNKQKSVLKAFGPPEKCAAAEAAIANMIDSESSSAMEISLKPEEFQWACSGGFKMIANLVGEHTASFDIISSPKRILIGGPRKDYETALRMVKSRTVETNIKEVGAEDCSVCWTQADNAISTKCGHVYCMECFEGLCTAASSTSKDFSVICQGDLGKCGVIFSLEELQEHLSSNSFEEVLEASFASHVQRNPAIYSYCPKPDCGMIYRITDTTRLSTCSKCLTVACTSCRVSHEGKNCAEYKDEASGGLEATKKLKKELGIKDCPKCGIGLEKTEGCNHMTCSCGAHVCWEHGGIGLGLGGI